MNRNRILLVYRGGTAGILSTVSNQARRLAMEGFETTLVLMGDPDRGRNHQEIEGVEVRWLHLWSRKLPKNGFGWFVKYLEFSIRVFIKTLFDPAKLVVANDIDSLLPVWPAARLPISPLNSTRNARGFRRLGCGGVANGSSRGASTRRSPARRTGPGS
jgi:hypothetical protein